MPLLCFTLCKHYVSATQTLFQLILSAGLQGRYFSLSLSHGQENKGSESVSNTNQDSHWYLLEFKALVQSGMR